MKLGRRALVRGGAQLLGLTALGCSPPMPTTLLSNGNGTFSLVASGGFSFDSWADGSTRFLPGDFSGDSKVDFIAIQPRTGTYAYTFLMN
ncbi:hypothetical protein [Corallococcus exiguus]|uniref:hypothetical protein n=1 Tax=Corallococcus exiguus TaxID=83462 RepID=UPI001561638F|nr:hypothetical protein [Corallococcus exiguus]NRD48140.1 hypothetical protein [Corallococcus exiguus]